MECSGGFYAREKETERERETESTAGDESFDEALPPQCSSVKRKKAAFSLFGSLWMSDGFE